MKERKMQSIMSKIPDVIFVLGGPGSGKGTVCTSLANVNVKDFMIGFLTVYLNFCFVFFMIIEVQVCSFVGR